MEEKINIELPKEVKTPKVEKIYKREYRIFQAKNGFIIRFEHEDSPYSEQNQRVAKNLEELCEIINKDIIK